MDKVKMRHPEVDAPAMVPVSAVPQHVLAGWTVDESGDPPEACPLCGRPAPAPPPSVPDSNTPDSMTPDSTAPATAGASSSRAPAGRRRRGSEES
ncbi:hypothetical protein [Actinomadura formosensis]|uniref:hypothetical protein n=1 Tax=Actinomadura formosensis TaxID=60706 RepID=UPI003D93F974